MEGLHEFEQLCELELFGEEVGADVVHPDPDPIFLVGVEVSAEFHLQSGIGAELLFLYRSDQLPQILHVLHFRCVDPV